MFEIAPQVMRWHADGQDAVLARVISVPGPSSSWPAQAVALSSSHRLTGEVLASVADPQLLPVLTQALTAFQSAQPSEDDTAQASRSLASQATVIDVLIPDEQARGAGLAS